MHSVRNCGSGTLPGGRTGRKAVGSIRCAPATLDIDYTSPDFDSHLAIWAADGTLLGHNDDYDHRGGAAGSTSDLDSLHALYLLSTGTYIVGVAKSSAGPDVGGFTGNHPESGDSYYLHVSVEGQPVPKPSSLALLGLGAALLFGWTWSVPKRLISMCRR
jgi:hypothetical protein